MKCLWLKSLSQNQIAINSNLFNKLNNPDTIAINIGMFKIKQRVIIKNDILDDFLALPKNLTDKYTIPTDIPYEVYYRNSEIFLGPVIGHIVTGTFENLNSITLSAYISRLSEYQTIKGLIFICTKDSIYIEESLIKGYYYNPKGQKTGSVWKIGTFPLPNAIFNRSYISQKSIKALQDRIGDKIFNSYWKNLSKLDIWERLSKDKDIVKHLPYTEKYTDIKQLKRLIKKYNSVYLKPFAKSQGKGIINLVKNEKQNSIIATDGSRHKYPFTSYKDLEIFLKDKLYKPSIIQQAVPFRSRKRMVDFRVILQRDFDKEWAFKGSFAKIAKPGSVITNSISREKVIDGREAIINIFKLSTVDAIRLENEMITLAKKAVNAYEESGIHIGDVAADIILDAKHQLWLLELQLNHGISEILPPEIFNEIKVTPIRYAKALAGFIF